jgi:hypothetical protein
MSRRTRQVVNLTVVVIATVALHSAVAALVFFSASAVFLARRAYILWRRTSLVLSGCADALGVVGAVVLAAEAWHGRVLERLPSTWWALSAGWLAAVIGVSLADRYMHRDEWNRVNEALDDGPLWHWVASTGVPQLRGGRLGEGGRLGA